MTAAATRGDYLDRAVCLRICEAYGGDPTDADWQSVEGIARILDEMTSTALAHGREAALAKMMLPAEVIVCESCHINPAPDGALCTGCAAEVGR